MSKKASYRKELIHQLFSIRFWIGINQPLIPPRDIPEIMYFLANRKIIIIGRTTIVEAAIILSFL